HLAHPYLPSFPTRRSSDLLVMLRNAFQHLELREENTILRSVNTTPYEIVGESGAMRALTDKIKKVGPTPDDLVRCSVYAPENRVDRKSTRLNSSHRTISYA